MRTLRFRRAAIALVAAFTPLAAAFLQGQQDPSQGPRPTFRAGVDSVSVDVLVTDKQGNPITDLTKDDFEIREAGKPQVVEAFKFVKIDDGIDDPQAAREILSMQDQEREVAREDNRLFVIFLDDYHVRRGSSMAGRERLAQWVSSLAPHDLVAVASPLSIVSGLTFSRSHASAASTIRAFEGRKYDYTPRNAIERQWETLPPEAQEQARNDLVIAALRNLSQQLGTMRDGRKTILYVSEGMTGSIPAGVRTRGSMLPSRPAGAQGPNQTSRDFFESASLLNNMQDVYAAANRNNVAIYTIDPRGLGNFEFGVEEDVTQADDRRILAEGIDMLRTLSSQTDGRAIVNSNDPLPALRQMVRDNSAYYLLGYTSTLAPRDGKFHEIQVRVKRPNVDVRARKGYWAYSPEDVAKATTATSKAGPSPEVSSALGDLSSGLDAGRAHAVATWLGAVRGTGEKARVTFAWEATATGVTDTMDTVDRVSIVAYAVTGDEVYTGTIAREAQAARAGGQASFDAPAGTVRVKITAENARGVRVDTDEAAMTVPDFTGAGPQISTPFVYRGRTARDLQQVRTGGAAVPAVRRVFSRTERLLVRFGAYGPAGTTPAVALRLLNQNGASIAALPVPAKTDAGFESEITLGSFPPGDYLIEITAESAGESTRQLLGIRVTG